MNELTRRELLKRAGLIVGGMVLSRTAGGGLEPVLNALTRPQMRPEVARVALVVSDDRASGARQAIDLLRPETLSGRTIFLKPNYNTAGPAPAATDTGLLEALVQELQNAGAGEITIGDRSGMADTRDAMESKGVFDLADRYGLATVAFDELDAGGWQYFPAEGTHWPKGFAVARPVLMADAVVNTCCVKTHRFGGHFTLSLKNSVGMVAKYVPGDPHDYMSDLHSSPHQRRMIAEVNSTYEPALVLLDGVDALLDGGPDVGTLARPRVILAGTDRVAVDAIGVAVLRSLGTTPEVQEGSIWDLEQIRRAVELGLGVSNGDRIELVTADVESTRMADGLRPLI